MAKRDMPKIDENLEEKKDEVVKSKEEVKETKPTKKSRVAKGQ